MENWNSNIWRVRCREQVIILPNEITTIPLWQSSKTPPPETTSKIKEKTDRLIETASSSLRYTQSPLIRTTAKLPTLGVLKNSSNLDAHWFLIPRV